MNVWVVKWTRYGVVYITDFGERDDALAYAEKLTESNDRENVMVLQDEAPEIDAATAKLIAGRVKDRMRNEALLASLGDRIGE